MATQVEATTGEGASLRLRQAVLADRAARDEAERGIDSGVFWTGAARAATIGIFLILFFALLDQARALLLPVTAAVVIGLMLGPLSALGQRHNVPSWLSALVLTVLFLAVVNAVITLLAAPLVEWVGKAPEIANTIREKLQVLERPLAMLRELRNAILSSGSDGALRVDTGGPSLLAPALTLVTPAIGQILLFIGTLFFFLLGRDEMRKYLVSFFADREARLRVLRILNDMEQKLTNYLTTVTAINFAVGCATGILALVVGLPNPYVWGVLAFVFNYVPYIGPAIIVVVLLGAGLVSFPTLAQALIAPAVYLGFVTLEGHFITPGIISRSLTLSPLTVFLALAFWTWIWGPIGAFLAVPLLIAALSALHHIRPRNETNLPG